MYNTTENKIRATKNRIHRLKSRGDRNIKSGGVMVKLNRQLRNLEKEASSEKE